MPKDLLTFSNLLGSFLQKGFILMKKLLLVLAVFVMLIASRPMLAQGGFNESPENPTAVLALVGSAGGFLVVARSRLRRK